MMASSRVQANVLPRKSMVIAEIVGNTVTRLKRYGKKGKQVNALDEHEKTSEDRDKDIGELSNGLCAVRFDAMSDDVENE